MTDQLTGLRQLRLKNPNHCKSPFIFLRQKPCQFCSNQQGEGGKKKRKNHRKRAVYTWQNCQPCSVKGYPNRITRQACILPSILKSYIPNIENLNLFVRGVNTGSLKKNKREAREKKLDTERIFVDREVEPQGFALGKGRGGEMQSSFPIHNPSSKRRLPTGPSSPQKVINTLHQT